MSSWKVIKRRNDAINSLCIKSGLMNDQLFSIDASNSVVVFPVSLAGIGSITRESLLECLLSFGHVQRLEMYPGKPYAIAKYTCLQDATCAKQGLNGTRHQLFQNRVVFCEYASHQLAHVVQDARSIPGLHAIPEFITAKEEAEIVAFVDALPHDEWTHINGRRVKHYGRFFDYTGNQIRTTISCPDIPPLLQTIRMRLPHPIPDQLTISYYPPGCGIPPHVDSHFAFESTVHAISLLSPTVMEFRSVETKDKRLLDMDPRGLVVLKNEARYWWEHAIRERKTDMAVADGRVFTRGERISLTWRTGNISGECECGKSWICKLRHGGDKLGVI
jgi:alkylated DNA repair dioxygenase AlkB